MINVSSDNDHSKSLQVLFLLVLCLMDIEVIHSQELLLDFPLRKNGSYCSSLFSPILFTFSPEYSILEFSKLTSLIEIFPPNEDLVKLDSKLTQLSKV